MKVLLTGGCSFSECISEWIDTWPRHLARHLSDYQHISTGMGSQGNGLISRRIIFQVTELLKKHKTQEVLEWCQSNLPNIPDNGFVAPPQCMPDEFRGPNTLEAYKRFFVNGNGFPKFKSKNSW